MRCFKSESSDTIRPKHNIGSTVFHHSSNPELIKRVIAYKQEQEAEKAIRKG